MRRQRNMAQMKGQKKSLGKELNKMETDAEFKILIIRMLSELKGRVDEFSENCKEIRNKNRDRKCNRPVRRE